MFRANNARLFKSVFGEKYLSKADVQTFTLFEPRADFDSVELPSSSGHTTFHNWQREILGPFVDGSPRRPLACQAEYIIR